MRWTPTRREVLISSGVAAGLAVSGHGATAAIAGRPSDVASVLGRRWDYVIVGGGSAGCVLARRLSEDADVQVLLIEAGNADHDPAIDAPPACPGLAGGSHDWKYRSTPQAGLFGRCVNEPRGKGLGGSSLINALCFQRGPPEAYDRWAAETGDDSWSAKGLLPYFRRLESYSGGDDVYHGDKGPLHILKVGDVLDRNPLSAAFGAAAIAAGHPLNPDVNGASADGTAWVQLTIRDGVRDNAASAFVDPVRGRPNLGIATGVQALGLDIRKHRCAGVRLSANGVSFSVWPAHDTILCAGAFDTPRLLMQSGVGDTNRLRALGIPGSHHLPGVGQNLQDHPLVPGLLFRARRPIPLSHYNHAETIVFTRSQRSPGWCDLQLMGLSVPFLSPTLGTPPPQSFSIVPALVAPRSRGSVTLGSSDAAASARIDPGYLSDPEDVEALVDAVLLSREIAASAPLREWIDKEIFPGPQMTARAALGNHIRNTASPFYHPVSTCRMGHANDPSAVVDSQCRVRGLAGLRIVDASIFPSIPQAMTHAAVLAVAERASDIIRGRATIAGT